MKVLFSVFILFSFIDLFSQASTTKKVNSDTLFGEAVHVPDDSLPKFPVNEKMAGKWVLISTKEKKGHPVEMSQWGIQTLEFRKDGTLIITPGPKYDRTIYWWYSEPEKIIVLFSKKDGEKLMNKVTFPVLKMGAEEFITTEWVNVKSEGKRYQKLTFLRVE